MTNVLIAEIIASIAAAQYVLELWRYLAEMVRFLRCGPVHSQKVLQ